MVKRSLESLYELAKTVVLAGAIAIGIRTLAFEPFNIPSGSMIPTLLVGDYLFVSKYSYGYSRHSMPWSLPIIDGRVFADEPERGDVAVFKKPTDTSQDFIKRIVGMPGDTIQVKDGILHINGEPVERRRVEDYIATGPLGRTIKVSQYVETLPDGASYRILERQGDRGEFDNTGVFQVRPGHYFMMGDNRDNSVDSRSTSVGQVPFENFVGRAEIIFFSTDGTAAFHEIWKVPTATRFSRLFMGIE